MESADTSGVDSEAIPESLERLICVSVTHQSHGTAVVGGLTPVDPRACSRRVHDHERVTEAVVLSTCNRVEVYASTRTASESDRTAVLAAIEDAISLPADARIDTDLTAVDHLMRVAAGLESAVIGEDEILGQTSDAFTAATADGRAAGVLGRVGAAAIRAGRRTRTETRLGDGPSGYESAVCRTLESDLEADPDRIVVVGAGEMATAVVHALQKRWDVRVDVVNRSRSPDLPSPDGRWWPLSALGTAVEDADAVITATGADAPVFRPPHAEQCAPGTPIIDLATPADVASSVRANPDFPVTSLDSLAARVRQSATRRADAVTGAEDVIADTMRHLVREERENRAENVLRAIHRDAALVRAREVERAKRRLDASDADAGAVLEDLASALAGKLLAEPTEALRGAARERDDDILRAAYRLFDVDDDR